MKKTLKLAILVFSLISMIAACGGGNDAPPNPPPPPARGWAWISGSETTWHAGIYGTKGGASPLYVPGTRVGSVSWLDSNGKLWLFGGEGVDSAGYWDLLNDLWMCDPTTLKWMWVSGSNTRDQAGVYGIQGKAAPSNVPGARSSAVSWIDSGGELWLFGGFGFVSEGNFGELNDLWKFDPTTNEWTWISGSDSLYQAGVYGTKGVSAPSNVPGARTGAVSWRDSGGQFWLFGGSGYDSVSLYAGVLNDLWKFNPTTNEWTWISGSDVADQLGVYGVMGVADPSNVPGARVRAVSWIDSQGKLWLFGGTGWGNNIADNVFVLNDLWKFDPATMEWTWMSGGDRVDGPGVYGTKGTAAPANTPGARESAVSWLDSGGKLWLFGGGGNASADSEGLLNDLWQFDPVTLEWTWVSGSDTAEQAGVYGTKGTAADSNVPGGRSASVSWIDSQGKLWLFGGYGYGLGVTYPGLLNDLWQYIR